MSDPGYRIADLGDRRVLTVDGRDYTTRYSERVIRMLVTRKGARRAHLYFPYKDKRAPLYLDPLFRWLRSRGARGLSVLEVGCSFGHMTEYLADQSEVATIDAFDTDREFVEIVKTKVDEMRMSKVRSVTLLSNDETRRLPWADGAFDLVLASGVIEHLPRDRRAHVDQYYRVLVPGGYIAIVDTPNRAFPLETHSIGLPVVQWLPPTIAYRYAQVFRSNYRRIPYEEFTADGTGWRNASLKECLPSSGMRGLTDVTEEAGYGWRFFQDTARTKKRRALLPVFSVCVSALRSFRKPPSLCLPYFNLLFRKDQIAERSP